jgi:hypothetical protein
VPAQVRVIEDHATQLTQKVPPQIADELRAAAAAHYGGMVTMCVACHNQFRPSTVR